MVTDQNDMRQEYIKIQKILLNEWDPIGVKDNAQNSDEYDQFIPSIYSLLDARATEEQIYEELMMVALENLGSPRSEELIESSRNVAKRIKALRSY